MKRKLQVPTSLQNEFQQEKDSRFHLNYKKKQKVKKLLIKNKKKHNLTPTIEHENNKIQPKFMPKREHKRERKFEPKREQKPRENQLLKIVNESKIQEENEILNLKKKLKIKEKLTKEFVADGLDYLLGDFHGIESTIQSESVDESHSEDEEDEDESEVDEDEEEEDEEEDEDEDTHNELEKDNPKIDIYGQNAQKIKAPVQTTTNALLHRKLKGLFNRLTIENIDKITNEILELAKTNTRNDMTTNIATVVIDAVANQRRILDKFHMTFGMILALLYGELGTDFGANLVQKVVEEYISAVKNRLVASSSTGNVHEHEDESPQLIADKKCTNLATLLAYFYNYHIVSCKIIYDIIRILVKDISECHLEILVKILGIATKVRSDDPTALGEIILECNRVFPSNSTPRAKFLLQQLEELKNNKKKNMEGDKIWKAIVRKRGLTVREPLGVTLNDILNIDTLGKWWLVGASWKKPGTSENETKNPVPETDIDNNINSIQQDNETLTDKEIQGLARAHQMNTSVRHDIFRTIVTSSDYMDCHHRLIRLKNEKKLTGVQQRDYIRILFKLARSETEFNAFYSLVISELIQDVSHAVTLKYAIWDYIKEISDDELEDDVDDKVGRIIGVICVKGFALSFLKVVNFTALSPRVSNFIHGIFKVVLNRDQQAFLPPNIRKHALKCFKVKDGELAKGLRMFLRLVENADADLLKEAKSILKMY